MDFPYPLVKKSKKENRPKGMRAHALLPAPHESLGRRIPPPAAMEQPARPLGASCCSNVGWLVRSVAWCPFEEGSHLLAAAGDTAALLELRDAADGRATLAPAEGMAIPIDGDVDAIAWGRVHGQICLTAIAGGSVSQHLCAAQGHSLSSGVLQLSSPVVNAPVYSACHLAREMLALTGASRQCSLLALGEGAASLSRTIALHSEGVAVRAHHAQPDHLMVAEACGGVHFLDLREPEGPHPTLSRTLPPAAAAAGLRDADWCPGDSHLVSGLKWSPRPLPTSPPRPPR